MAETLPPQRTEEDSQDFTVTVGRLTYSRRLYLVMLVVITTLSWAFVGYDSIAPGLALPEMLKPLHITIGEGGTILSGGFILAFGLSYLMGPLIDRWGRKRSFLLLLLGTSVASGFTGLVGAFWSYYIVRFFAGSGRAIEPAVQPMVAEEAPARLRGRLLGIQQLGFSAGSVAVALIAAALLPLGQWRLLFFIGFLPALLVVGAFFTVREPPRAREAALVKHGEADTASNLSYAIDLREARKFEWRQVFADAGLRRLTIAMSVIAFLGNLGVDLVLSLGPTYETKLDHLSSSQTSYITLFFSLAQLAGILVSGWITDYTGPKKIWVFGNIVGGVALYFLGHQAGYSEVLASLIAWGFLSGAATSAMWRYVIDLYPTRVRGTGYGIIMGGYWLASFVGPTLYGYIIQAGGLGLPAIIGSGSAIVAGLVALIFVRSMRSAGKELEMLDT